MLANIKETNRNNSTNGNYEQPPHLAKSMSISAKNQLSKPLPFKNANKADSKGKPPKSAFKAKYNN